MQIVTWGELMIGLIVLGMIWYAYVILRYYRNEITRFGHARNSGSAPVKWRREAYENNSHIVEKHIPLKSDPHAQVHELMQELKLVFAAAVRDQLSKEQILEPLAIWLPKYRTLPGEIKASISQHIVTEFSLQLKMSVTIEEVNALW